MNQLEGFIIEINIKDIPVVLAYFIPGYIALSLYNMMCAEKIQTSHKVWLSCVISYVFNSIIELIAPRTSSVYATTLATIVLTCVCTILFSLAVKRTDFKKFITRRFHFSPANNIWNEVICADGDGSTMRIKLKGKEYFVEGAVASYGDPDDKWIALAFYSFFEMKENCEPYYTSDDPDKYFVFNVNDVEFIEVWPTILEEKKSS